MLELLNKYIRVFLFIGAGTLFLAACTDTKSKKNTSLPQKNLSHTTKHPLKKSKESVSKKDSLPKKKKEVVRIPKEELLIKDIINQKNVRSFFLDYGRKNPETKLLLKTRLGNMHITLYKQTPLHRASFIYLIKNGYFNKTCFHRIVKDFIIQGGWSDQAIVDKYRIQLNRYRLPAEFRKGVNHKRGALSATRRWVNNPDKMSSPFEFFIVQTDIDCSHLNGEHTVFGQVTKGFEVIDKIAAVKLDGNSEWPEVDVDITFEILD
ncbi:peptidylprolyl isomerase [Ochrovirga pacifica]|uniref:peptidylprolyl isomerase n=1 Tax=Ochrovirga pacifica TaxID=1042376 RepID=UPI000317B938|nr:peptidylprolyl isomerase [Ochrovirga pacifica]